MIQPGDRLENPVTGEVMAPGSTPHVGRGGGATPLLARLGDFAYRRRGRIVAAWVVVLAAVLAFVPGISGDFGGRSGTPGSDSRAAADLIDAHFPQSSGTSVNVVWQPPRGSRRSPRRRGRRRR